MVLLTFCALVLRIIIFPYELSVGLVWVGIGFAFDYLMVERYVLCCGK